MKIVQDRFFKSFYSRLLDIVIVSFASISKKTSLSKLTFAFVLISLSLIVNYTSKKFIGSVIDNGKLTPVINFRLLVYF